MSLKKQQEKVLQLQLQQEKALCKQEQENPVPNNFTCSEKWIDAPKYKKHNNKKTQKNRFSLMKTIENLF